MRNEFTAIIEPDGDWYIAYCPEIPGANGQGHTIPEALHSLAEAISLILEDRREDALRGMPREAIREVVIEKSGEVIFHFKDPLHPQDLAARVCARPSARCRRRWPRTCRAPPQRHMEQDHGPGMESFSPFFDAHLNAGSYQLENTVRENVNP